MRSKPGLVAVTLIVTVLHMALLLVGYLMPEEHPADRYERLREESCSKSVYEVGGGCIFDGGYIDWSYPGSYSNR